MFSGIIEGRSDLINCSTQFECLYQKKKSQSGQLFTVCGSLLSGHSAPSASCGGDAAGNKATEATQERNKSLLVMSGGEGYIDFRMGESATCSGWNIILSTTAELEKNVTSLYCMSLGDEDGEAEEGEDAPMKLQPFLAKAERSHLIVWQLLASED